MSTIAAISTSPGIGGIGMIRMSGENCFEILDKFFVPKNKTPIKGYSMKYGNVVDNFGNVVDEVLVSYFLAPKSYTTENMCEINSHGGLPIMNKILEICLKNGAVLAEPGEFTKRAFLNGRIDLSQAEAVVDIINSKTEKESKIAVEQLTGNLSEKIKEIRQKIVSLLADIEVTIDYPEYDVEDVTESKISHVLKEIDILLNDLEKSFLNGKILKEGVKVAIIGKPNAGKSSLLNLILNEERAIVTDIEGTTRDSIEEFITIDGVPLKIIDTAGIRNAKDEVEKIGVEKAKKYASEADLIVYVVDGSMPLDESDYEIMKLIADKKAIVLLNKTDLVPAITEESIFSDMERFLKELPSFGQREIEIIRTSTKENVGIDLFENKLKEMFFHGEISFNDEIVITNMRHKEVLKDAYESMLQVKKSLENDMPEDFYSIDLMSAYASLGTIIGEEVGEDLVNEIFSEFCMGK